MPATTHPPSNITLAVTGASGSIYAAEILRALAADTRVTKINFVASDSALRVFAEELHLSGRNDLAEKLLGAPCPKLQHHAETDIAANIASGSYPTDAMIVLPCSMGTLASIANGCVGKDCVPSRFGSRMCVRLRSARRRVANRWPWPQAPAHTRIRRSSTPYRH